MDGIEYKFSSDESRQILSGLYNQAESLKTKLKMIEKLIADLELQLKIYDNLSYEPLTNSDPYSNVSELKEPLKKHFTRFKDDDSVTLSEDSIYSPTWSWIDKIRFILIKNNTPMKAKKIIAEISKLEPSIEIKKLTNSVNSTLSQKVKKGEIFNRSRNKDENSSYYGLLIWEN
jgi:hypothetical protein